MLLLAGLATAAPATAEPEPGQLVVEGRGSTTAELVLDREVLLRLEPPVVSGGRDYAGVLIEGPAPQWRSPLLIGGVRVGVFADGTQDAIAPIGFTDRLPKGRYRVTLFGDGPVRASFALSDPAEPGLTVVPRETIPVRFLHRAETLALGAATADVDIEGALPPGRRAVQVALLDDASADRLQMCATAAGQCERPLGRLSAALPGGTSGIAQVVTAAPEARSLLWASTGVRAAEDRLRAAALVF